MLSVNIQKKLAHFELDVDFKVAKNEIIALFGPSGSGKTTILNCIAGLTKATDGLIQLNNRSLFQGKQINIPIQRRKIGYLFQDYALFPHLTAWKNIAYGMNSEPFAKQLMKELRIDHLADQYPNEISGGEKQRVAIARALATEPDLLLLDEPFSALDDATREKSHEELLRLHSLWEIPIILVTHSRSEAEKLATRILYLEEGQLQREQIQSKFG
ncbi:ATP-binding cassette domain-containing protein [Sporosarcina sp. G11-34]|uniref:ATP-binding cassette domain-containing protein n=1 Tax=Sporosarcina sp. G11-34 TaxID=2849605 RepID=UPI0022A9EDA4|nr:ATP-binding cassette domain-containing protein [Sporosarcina sp. G11-34]MCZ2259436.1 ATP-binding cassette domain-containing protein [Sporosarcina sp. G11-34]